MKFLVIAFVSLLSLSAIAVENQNVKVFENGEKMEILNDEFLGCVETRQDCRHEARHNGYHHSRVRRDHHVCTDHHHPWACYGVE